MFQTYVCSASHGMKERDVWKKEREGTLEGWESESKGKMGVRVIWRNDREGRMGGWKK